MLSLKDRFLLRQQTYVDGAWCDADEGRTIDVINPATGEALGTVPHMGMQETRRAIDATNATNAVWPAWRRKTARERAQILRSWYDLMLQNADDLAAIMTAEQGKPLAEAKGERAGVPRGVYSIVIGDARKIGAEMCANPVVRKLSFTGSTAVGRQLMQQCAPTVKKLSLELGGNASFIVFDHTDLDATVEGAMASKYRNMGHTCVCANRVYVQDSVYDLISNEIAPFGGVKQSGLGREGSKYGMDDYLVIKYLCPGGMR